MQDDGVNEFVEKAYNADGFVFATKFKPGAAVAVARRGGTTAALDAINILVLHRYR